MRDEDDVDGDKYDDKKGDGYEDDVTTLINMLMKEIMKKM
jgi:hypothetical protein